MDTLLGKHLVPFLKTPQLLQDSIELLVKLHKIREFVKTGFNAADILLDPKNNSMLAQFFGTDLNNGLKIFLNYAVSDLARLEFNQNQEVTQTAWMVKFAKAHGDVNFTVCVEGEDLFWLGNPGKHENLRSLSTVPQGALVSLSAHKKGVAVENLQNLLQEYRKVFDTQTFEASFVPKVEATEQILKAVERKPAPQMQNRKYEMTVHKLDTFVHAGNATLMVDHLRKYKIGKVRLFVYREKIVEVDPYSFDAIWSAQIKNDEQIAWVFPEKDPDPVFVKELMRRTTCYAQLDKARIAG